MTAIPTIILVAYVANALFVAAWVVFTTLFWSPPTTNQILSRIAVPFWWLFKETRL